MTDKELAGIHEVQLELMDEIHRMCCENDIMYYLIGGSCLGAVRHNGFIPWDLDIDIGMMRKDYEKFCRLCAEGLDERYDYRDYTNTKDYIKPHAIFCKKNTCLINIIEEMNPKMGNLGIYIDIFPLDNVPADEKSKKKQARDVRRIYKFKSYRLPYSYSVNPVKRKLHYALSAMLSFIPMSTVSRWQQNIMKRFSSVASIEVCSMASKYSYKKQTMPISVYGNGTLIDFEDRQYYVPEKFVEYLERLYGDYMKLPSEEEIEKNLAFFSFVDFGQNDCR